MGENPAGGGTIPLNRWACIEWKLDNVLGEIRVFVDGVAAASNTGHPAYTTNFAPMAFGIHEFSKSAQTVEIYFDDLALNTSRIGCP